MKSFKEYVAESDKPTKSIHYFDIDDTLSHPPKDVQVHVNDPSGKRVQSLSTTEFNTHKLPAGHSYDFSDFKSAEKFKLHPIRPMLAKMKGIHKSGGNVEILTARSDFDDKHKFAQQWKRFGVDINKIHVRRAGNVAGSPASSKAKIISNAIKKNGHKEVHLYDDSKDNIDAALALKKHHPDVTFHGHHVEHNPDGTVKVTHYKA